MSSFKRLGVQIEVTKDRDEAAKIDRIVKPFNIEDIDFNLVFDAFKLSVATQLAAAKAGIKAEMMGPGNQALEFMKGRQGRSIVPFALPELSDSAYLSTLAYCIQRGAESGEEFTIKIGGMSPMGKNVSEYAALIDKAFSGGQYIVQETHVFRGETDGEERYTTLHAGQVIQISQPLDTEIAFDAAIEELNRQIRVLTFRRYDGIPRPMFAYKNPNAKFPTRFAKYGV